MCLFEKEDVNFDIKLLIFRQCIIPDLRQDSKPMTAFPVHDEAHDASMTLPP